MGLLGCRLGLQPFVVKQRVCLEGVLTQTFLSLLAVVPLNICCFTHTYKVNNATLVAAYMGVNHAFSRDVGLSEAGGMQVVAGLRAWF